MTDKKENPEIRLNKWIADSGLCSRREADRLIEAGEVTVNGKKVLALGTKLNPERDKVLVQGNPLPRGEKLYLLFHKPTGYITTRSDERGRQTIYGLLPSEYQTVDPAGRLDKESSGVLILSNDGDFLYRITHPKFHLRKVYRVTVRTALTEAVCQKLLDGVLLEPEGKLAKVDTLEAEDPFTLKLTLLTGYNRQIRRSLEALGYQIKTLKRLSVGPVTLGSLKPGKTRRLTRGEIKALAGNKF